MAAVKIIDIGDESLGESVFQLNKAALQEIFEKLPSQSIKIAVVSIVGAFRTGKSFLLSFFLRYLRYISKLDNLQDFVESFSDEWLTSEGGELSEGNLNTSQWTTAEDSHRDVNEIKAITSFPWRGGYERQTTGIWMWSEPFILHAHAGSDKQDIAVLLMDTQGMFDNQTSMLLTTQIFGLSTLVSSFQIYNVEKRIGEDNLQHLALFSEYGRMALMKDKSPVDSLKDNKSEIKDDLHAFQRLQFLVRDYQNFDRSWEDDNMDMKSIEDKQEFFAQIRQHTSTYLGTVLENKAFDDLQTTRDQINRCFKTIDCFLLPHPGSEATKKNFNGNISKLDSSFRALLNEYIRSLFTPRQDETVLGIEPKRILSGRYITGPELMNYFEAYVRIFQSGSNAFPEPMTMLEATAEANNRNAHSIAINEYKVGMESTATGGYIKEDALLTVHSRLLVKVLGTFDDIASMGPLESIIKYRKTLETDIEAERERFFQLNSLRNPYRDIERYVLPASVGVVAYLGSKLVDAACSTDFCENTEDALERLYMVILVILCVLGWRYFRTMFSYFSEIISILKMHHKQE